MNINTSQNVENKFRCIMNNLVSKQCIFISNSTKCIQAQQWPPKEGIIAIDECTNTQPPHLAHHITEVVVSKSSVTAVASGWLSAALLLPPSMISRFFASK